MTAPAHRLIEAAWPEYPTAAEPPVAPVEEFQSRIDRLRAQMEEQRLSHLVVYGDREHFANLAYLTNFDPRYEEALLVLSRARPPVVLVGNECENYLPISPLYQEGSLRKERFAPFSLPDQPRDHSRPLPAILADEGLGPGARVGCVGWKTFTTKDHPRPEHAIELPAFLVDTLRDLCGHAQVVNATDLF